ncbi:MAG: RNA-binding S4 domain-containing protein [Chthoniobacteraceae bacterium]
MPDHRFPAAPDAKMRLDQWLWAVRVYGTRAIAVQAIRGGHVKVNGQSAKPARPVRVGDEIAARTEAVHRKLRVLGTPPSRVGAPLVKQYAEDIAPPEPTHPRIPGGDSPEMFFRPRGSGRPTKRDRRRLEDFSDESGI